MRGFFEGIQYLCEEILFVPFHLLRSWENWWGANIVNWLLLITGLVAIVYWILQLKKFDAAGEEDKDINAHSFLP